MAAMIRGTTWLSCENQDVDPQVKSKRLRDDIKMVRFFDLWVIRSKKVVKGFTPSTLQQIVTLANRSL